MSHTVPPNPRQVYILRASIAEANPPIWRKLSVPGECTLGDLHIILQIAFGWENGHLHSFTINSTEYGMSEIDNMGYGDEFDRIDEDTVCLNQVGLAPKKKFKYLYDFGDSWFHEITVSKIAPAEDGEPPLPRCLEGERAGPLENSGGIWGYTDMLEILQNPNHAEYREIHEWAGDFDPEYVSMEEINARLEQVFKPRPQKAKKPRASK
jgi:hypothetical protein